jgi:Uma2 family endonuclease
MGKVKIGKVNMSEMKTNDLLTVVQLSTILEEKIAQIAPAWLAQKPHLRESLAVILADDTAQLLITTMNYEEFLAWATELDIHAEWIEGKVQLMSPPSTRHQDIVVFLVTLLNIYISGRNLGKVMTAPYQMRLHEPPRGREPDILFVAQANLGRITKQYLDGPADLVVEVISPESSGRDRGEKFYEYEMVGVREYWLIDPQREQVEFYQLDEQGHYTLALGGHTGAYTSLVIPGLTLDVEWLWQDPLPSVWMSTQS